MTDQYDACNHLQARVTNVIRLHQPRTPGNECMECYRPWPCTTHQKLTNKKATT